MPINISEEALDTRSNPSSQDHNLNAGYASGSEMALDVGRLGAETDVEREPATAVPGHAERLPPLPRGGGESDEDADAEMVEAFEEAAEVRPFPFTLNSFWRDVEREG